MIFELKRALFKKSNLIIIVLIVILMLINAYYDGWNTSLSAENASDIARASDRLFFKKYFGNTFRVWRSGYYMVQALAPLILGAPYMLSYLDEKTNHFRNFMIARKGIKKYLLHKTFAIVLAGTIILISAESMFAMITYFLTYPDLSKEFLENIVHYHETYFFQHPYLYFGMVLVSHALYYFCFLFFAIGIASLFKNKIAVIILPFLCVGILDLILPSILQPNVVMQFYYSRNFSAYGYIGLVIAYVWVGVALLIFSEHKYRKQGHL